MSRNATSTLTARLIVLVAASLISVRCSGTIGEADDDTPGSARGGVIPTGAAASPGAMAASGGAATGPATGSGAGAPAVSGPAPSNEQFRCAADGSSLPRRIWRLTRAQYANTLAVALNGRLSGGKRAWPAPDGLTPPFDTVASGDRFSNLSPSYGMTDIELGRALGAAADFAPKLVAAARAAPGSCLAANPRPPFDRCVASIVANQGQLLFRRPLTDEEVSSFSTLATANAGALPGGQDEALGLTFSAMLMSPSFLYRNEVGDGTVGAGGLVKLTPYQVAESLAYTLTDAPPDDVLWDAAQKNQLQTADQIQAQVLRLLGGDAPATAAVVRRFVEEYFTYAGVTTVFKDPKDFPFHDPAGLLDDTRRFVADALATNGRKDMLKTLLTSGAVFTRATTQQSYGLKATDADGVRMDAPAGQRAGLLTQPSFLVAYSTANENKPVQRGRFIVQSLLCEAIPDVPIGSVPPLPSDLGPNATLRTRLTVHAMVPRCAVCHDAMDAVGLALEQYDSVGRYRAADQGRPVDASGVLAGAGEADGRFANPIELTGRLASSSVVRRCFVRHSFRFWLGQGESDDQDGCTLAAVDAAYTGSGGDYVRLVTALFTSRSFLYRNTSAP